MMTFRGMRSVGVGCVLWLAVVCLCSCDQAVPGVDECAGEETRFTVSLGAPDPQVGYAPLGVGFEGVVSLLKPLSYKWTLDFGDGGQASGVNNQPRAFHEYEAAGRYEVRLIVEDEVCGARAIAQEEVEVLGAVELSGADLNARPGNVTILERVRLSLDVQNEAEAALTSPVTVSFFLSSRPGVLWGEVASLAPLTNVTLTPGRDGVTIEGLGTATINEEVEIPDSVLSGSYYVIAAIDLANEVGEGDEERNNLLSSAAPVFIDNVILNAADLIVDNVQVGPSSVFQRLSAISLNAEIKNIGSSPATTYYSVYLTDTPTAPAPGAVSVYTSRLIDIDPGDIETDRAISINLAMPVTLPVGINSLDVYVWVCVDPDELVNETDDSNNCAVSSVPILITDTPQEGVDIALVDFKVNPAVTFLDSTMEVTLEVANFGTQPTRSFFCGIYLTEDESADLSSPRLTNINFSNIDPGEVKRVTRTVDVVGVLPLGVFRLFAFCDPTNVVRETFEDNNMRFFDESLTILAEANVDLSVTGAALEPAQIEDGATLRIPVSVANSGETGSGPTVLHVHTDSEGDCGPGSPLLGTLAVPPLGPQSDVELDLIVGSVSCEIFRASANVCLVIDPNNRVPELDEENNTLDLDEPLIFLGDRCQCELDLFEPNDTIQLAPPLGVSLHEDLTICQEGGRDNFAVDLSVGQSMTVRVSLEHGGPCTNLDVRLFAPNFQPIPGAVSQNQGPLEQVEIFLVQQQGRYTIRVEGSTACDLNRYDLQIDISDPGPGVDLTGADLEPDDLNPVLGQSVQATWRTLNIGDDDAAPYETTFYLSEDTEPGDGDFVLATVDEAGLQGARVRDGDVAFDIPVGAVAGTYFVCAVLDSESVLDETNEGNNVVCSAQIEVDTSCYDPFERNDTAEEAADIEPGDYEDLSVCDGGRQDNYRFCVEEGHQIDLRVDFIHADGDIDMRLMEDGPGFPEVAHSTGVRDTEGIFVDFVDRTQCYIAQVLLSGNNHSSNNYDLSLEIEEAPPELRCDNLFEPNDSPDEAIESGADLAQILDEELILDRCPQSDFDFYYVDMVAGAEITLCAQNAPSNPHPINLNIALLDPAQTPIIAQTGTEPCLNYRLQVTGRYFVRILAADRSVRAVRYTLSLDGLFGVDLVGRGLTVNPSEIVPGGDEIVVYSFIMENARTDRVEDIDYGVYYSTDALIDPLDDFLIATRRVPALDGLSETSILDTLLMPAEGPYAPGAGYFGIYIDPDDEIDEENNGNNRLQAPIDLLICAEDSFEGNHTLETAAFIDLGALQSDLSICPETVDWFCLDDLPAGDYRAEIAFDLDPDDIINTDLNVEIRAVSDDFEDLGLLAEDIDIASGATVDFALDTPGDVCARISPLRTTGSNTYTLRVSPR